MRYIFLTFFLFPFFIFSQEISITINCKDIRTNRNISSVQVFKKQDSLLLGLTSYNGVRIPSSFQLEELEDTMCFKHPNFSFEDIPLNNYESLINDKKELVINVRGYPSHIYHTLNLNVTRTNRVEEDSIFLKVVDFDKTIGQKISFLPNFQDIEYPFKRINNQYILYLKIDRVRNGLIIIDKPSGSDTLLFERKNALQTIYINTKGLNKRSSEYAQKNILSFFNMLDEKNLLLEKNKKESKQKINDLEIELEKCKGEYMPEPEIDRVYPEEIFFRINSEERTVLPENELDRLRAELTSELLRLRIKKQTIVKILLYVGTDGRVYTKNLDGSKNTDINIAIRSVLRSNKWIHNYSYNHKLKHEICFILNLIPK